jgi:hypothetical protein
MENDLDLNDLVDKIESREDFVKFVQALLQDLQNNEKDWENTSLEHYLDAIASWTSGMDGYYKNMNLKFPDNINWKVMGEILIAARIYE